MTYQEFEDQLDALLLEAGPSETGNAVVARLPAALREKAAECERCRQLLTDWVWLHEQITQLPAPRPEKDFSGKVVARLAQPATPSELDDLAIAPTSSSGISSGISSRILTARKMGLLAGLAASITVVVMLLPRGENGAQIAGNDKEAPVDLREHLRDTGTAYLALARDMADAVRLADPETKEKRAPSKADSSETVTDIAVAARMNPPAIHEAIRGSTETFVDAGRDIGSTLRPITDSAVGAFSFLLPPSKSGDGEKPSI